MLVSCFHVGTCLGVPFGRGVIEAVCGPVTLMRCACVPLMVSCSGFGLPMHAQLLRLFVTTLMR